MPALLLHLAYAQAHLAKHPKLGELEVFRASVFPDIRMIALLPREQTHQLGLRLDEIENETDSWRVGWLLHSYLDEAWNEFVGESDEEVDHDSELKWRAIKLAEEADYFESMHNGEHIAGMFEAEPLQAELEIVDDPLTIERWNRYVVSKLRYSFDAEYLRRRAALVGTSIEDVDKLLELIEQIRGDRGWLARFDELHSKLGI